MKVVAVCLVLLCSLSLQMSALAAPSEADRATARALALEAHAALEKQDYATAADRFARADALVHAPTLVVDWASALQGLGRLVEAQEKYELVLREGIDSSAPKSWRRALEEAKKELDAIKPRLAWVTIVLKEPAEANVKLNGQPVPPAAIGVKRATDPGISEITVEAAGYESFRATLPLGPGEAKSLEVALKKRLEPVAPIARTSEPYRPKPRSATRRTATYAALGVGGAALLGSGVAGGLSLKKRSQLVSECVDGECRSSSRSTIEAYHRYGTISGVALAAGVAGLGTGLLLWLTEPKQDEPVRSGLELQPVLGLGMVGAEGTFQ